MWTGPASRRARRLVALFFLLGFATPARGAPEAPVFQLRSDLDLADLATVVREHTADLQSEALEVDEAKADVKQSHLLANPTLDTTWGTIPVGPTNPPDLAAPLANVPNYGVGLSYTFPIGKRKPRQEKASALERGAEAAFDAAIREHALELAKLIGEAATSMLRLDSLQQVAKDDSTSIALAESRLSTGFASPLDVDRLRIEVSHTQQQILSDESDLSESLAACAALTGETCAPFADAADARRFLTRWIANAAPQGRLEDRADLRALDAYREAADAELALAHAQVIPDPTLRIGYVNDRFEVSGAQENSLNASVSVPIPLFDRGQAQAETAASKRLHYEEQRAQRIRAAQAKIPALLDRVNAQHRRHDELQNVVVPRATRALDDIEHAANSGLLPLGDVIQARRTVTDLLLEDVDSSSDAFQAALALLAESAPAPSPTQQGTDQP